MRNVTGKGVELNGSQNLKEAQFIQKKKKFQHLV